MNNRQALAILNKTRLWYSSRPYSLALILIYGKGRTTQNGQMAKQDSDCITADLFALVPKIGRPRTNPLTREQQVRINKRNQLKRDRSSGLKRVELKLHTDMVTALEAQAEALGLTRGQLIETILNDYLNT